MKKLRFLLLDANVVIKLYELGLWQSVIDKCEILLARTVAEREAEFFFADDGQHGIDLAQDINSNRITVVDVQASDLKRFLDRFDPVYLERLDLGEAESLAYLISSEDPCLLCSSDAIVFRVLARLHRADQGLSLEEMLQRVGLGRGLPKQFTRMFREVWTKRGQEEMVRGIGLK